MSKDDASLIINRVIYDMNALPKHIMRCSDVEILQRVVAISIMLKNEASGALKMLREIEQTRDALARRSDEICREMRSISQEKRCGASKKPDVVLQSDDDRSRVANGACFHRSVSSSSDTETDEEDLSVKATFPCDAKVVDGESKFSASSSVQATIISKREMESLGHTTVIPVVLSLSQDKLKNVRPPPPTVPRKQTDTLVATVKFVEDNVDSSTSTSAATSSQSLDKIPCDRGRRGVAIDFAKGEDEGDSTSDDDNFLSALPSSSLLLLPSLPSSPRSCLGAAENVEEPRSLILPTLSAKARRKKSDSNCNGESRKTSAENEHREEAVGPGQKKKKRRRARGKSAYNMFISEMYPSLFKEYSSRTTTTTEQVDRVVSVTTAALSSVAGVAPKTSTMVLKELGRRWKVMSEDERKHYVESAKRANNVASALNMSPHLEMGASKKKKKKRTARAYVDKAARVYLEKIVSKKAKAVTDDATTKKTADSKTLIKKRSVPPPATEIVVLSKNPKRGKSRERYERYKLARTVQEYYDLGGSRADLVFDMDRGYAMTTTVLAKSLSQDSNGEVGACEGGRAISGGSKVGGNEKDMHIQTGDTEVAGSELASSEETSEE